MPSTCRPRHAAPRPPRRSAAGPHHSGDRREGPPGSHHGCPQKSRWRPGSRLGRHGGRHCRRGRPPDHRGGSPRGHPGRHHGLHGDPRVGHGAPGPRPVDLGRAPDSRRAPGAASRRGGGARDAPRASRRPTAWVAGAGGRLGSRWDLGRKRRPKTWARGSRRSPAPRGQTHGAGPRGPSAANVRLVAASGSRRRPRRPAGLPAWARSWARRAGHGGGASWGPCGPRSSGRRSSGPSSARMPSWAWRCSPVLRSRRSETDTSSAGGERASKTSLGHSRSCARSCGRSGPWGRFDVGSVTGAPGGVDGVTLCDHWRTQPCVHHLGGGSSLPAGRHRPDQATDTPVDRRVRPPMLGAAITRRAVRLHVGRVRATARRRARRRRGRRPRPRSPPSAWAAAVPGRPR